jgi:hypothetical protein
MWNAKYSGTACVFALLGSLGAGANAHADSLEELKAEIAALKTAYETRIAALETRIAQLESVPPEAAPMADSTPPLPPPVAGGGGQAAFNPAISLILAGNFASLSEDPINYRIAGFVPSGHAVGPGERSFNLGESELSVAANVDPYFFANLTASIGADDSIHAEEAYFKTLTLPAGLLVKGGRFFSGIGYLNEIHAHAWDFIDQPLVYQALLGGQYASDGLQVKWLAPIDVFLEFGAETGNGRSFPGTSDNRNGMNSTAVFAHAGNDIGDSASWRAGLSWLDQRAVNRGFDTVDGQGAPIIDAFTGSSRLWGVDFTFKWAPNGNSIDRQLKVQGEYLRRRESGSLAFDTAGGDLSGGFRSTQSGWYLQSVYQFRPRWRLGLRYDSLDSGHSDIGLVASGALSAADFPALEAASPGKVSFMLDWSASEFTRLRMQYAWDDARRSTRERQFFLQYLFSIGAHGAHKF